MRFQIFPRWCALSVCLGVCAMPAAGAAVEFAFGGEILYAGPELSAYDSGAVVGSRFSGRIHYETDGVEDSVPLDPAVGEYASPGYISVELGTHTELASQISVLVANDHPEGDDGFSARGADVSASRGLSIAHLLVSLYDPTRSALDSDALPTSIALSDFNSAFVEVSLENFDVVWHGEIDTFFAVPEPATGGMLALLAIVTCFPRTCGRRS